MLRAELFVGVTALALLACAAAPVTIEEAGSCQEMRLPDCADMSGVSWKGGREFFVVRDGGSKPTDNCELQVVSVPLDADGCLLGPPTVKASVPLAGACDAEGVALDPCSGNVWIADECGARIGEYDPATGEPTGRVVPVPGFVVDGVRGNLSLESLTISGDGMTMWTANEEALVGDGPPSGSDSEVSTVVRLMRFARSDASADWTPDGMWAYACDPVGWYEPVNSGVSDLCVLPDGSLLVLERECSYWTLGRTRIYRPDFTGATNVSDLASLTNRAVAAVRKGEPLYEVEDGCRYGDGLFQSEVACYEGLCLGPRNADGTVSLLLVSDGGASHSRDVMFVTVSAQTKPFVRALKLVGLDVCTLAFEPPGVGRADRTGAPYRYLRGAKVSVGYELPGAPGVGSAWTLPAHRLSGDGTNVAFTVACDDRLFWCSPQVAAERLGRLPEPTGELPDISFGAAAVRSPWRLGLSGFARSGVRLSMDGFGSGRTSLYGADLDLQYSLGGRGPYGLWLGIGGSYCPRQDDVFDRGSRLADVRGRLDLDYGEFRLMTVPHWRMTDDLSLGLRLGVAFDWLTVSSSLDGDGMAGSGDDTRFLAQGIVGVQATYRLTDAIGLSSHADWRHGGTAEFETDTGSSSADLSGWHYGVGVVITF